MQVLQAGEAKFVLLELEAETLENVANQLGFAATVEEMPRAWVVSLNAAERESPLLLFDAAEPANLTWFSRCQFYVDGTSGSVLQTPLAVANVKDRKGQSLPNALLLHIAKEVPANFKLPGRVGINEQVVYQIFYNFLHALQNTGVGLCGTQSVRPLSARAPKF
ncbi:MAG: hypothetical protein NW208_01390 [Bryobacter sp.]|nr:hypothetical protein [Bryobacter sp.]